MNNKYIIDGVEYEYGDEVEVSDDNTDWMKRIFVSYIKGMSSPVLTVTVNSMDSFKDGGDFNISDYTYIRKIQPTLSSEIKEIKKIDTYKIRGAYQEIQYTEQGSNVSGGDDTIDSIRYVADVVNEVIDVLNTNNLSGRKAKLILDGTEHTVTFE